MPDPAFKKSYTYSDYLNWPDDRRYEIIDGNIYNMTPAPSRLHQKVAGELFKQIALYLDDKECEVYFAPFDVRIPEADNQKESIADYEIMTVVQPDIVVVCDMDKLDERGCLGAPDFIIEIVSPATAAKDQIEKTALYEKSGVREYWIVHPNDRVVTVRVLRRDGKYETPKFYHFKGKIESTALAGLTINFDVVFS